jgi:hypothetical protein
MIASATEAHRAAATDVSVSVRTDNSDHGDNSGKADDGNHFTPAKNPNISVGIPAIAFTKDIVSTGGQLRTPVLINAAERAGTATLVRDGVPTSCSVQAQPGVPAWLTCSLNASSTGRGDDDSQGSESQRKSSAQAARADKNASHVYTVVVTTTNGLTATHAVTVA